jgi:maltoporin
MRRVLQLSGLSGLFVTGFLSTQAFAQEPTSAEAQPPAAGPEAEAPAPVAPTAEVAAPAVAPAVAPAAKPKFGDLSTHGYFRGGFGVSGEKGRQTCFGLYSINGSLKSKYRLGNECEVWAELDITSVLYAGDDGSVGSFHFMPTAFIPQTYIGYAPAQTISAQDQQGFTSTGATLAFPNLYADIKGISWLFGGTAWGGSRYYKRESIYISDFFYWNPSGLGVGIEDVTLGKIWESAPDMVSDLRLSYAAFAVDGQPNGNPYVTQQYTFGIRHDVQLRGFRPYKSGEFQVGFQYIQNLSRDKNDKGDPATTFGGWGITVQHVQDVFGFGNNKLAFQYGNGGGTGFGTLARFYYPDFSLNQDKSDSRLRLLDVLTIQPTAWFGAQAAFVFQRDDVKEASAGDWISAGTRLSFAVTEHAKVLGEVGHDRVTPKNGSAVRMLSKATLALAIGTAKGFWARPELRLYGTYATWNADARTAHIDSGDFYFGTDKTNGFIVGLQTEAMW